MNKAFLFIYSEFTLNSFKEDKKKKSEETATKRSRQTSDEIIMKSSCLLLVSLFFYSLHATTVAKLVEEDMKKVRIARSFVTGLIGDSLALGGHYEYDAKKIKVQVGRYINFFPPGESNNGIDWGTANYHPGKRAGDLTDAGEVAIMLL